MPSLRETLIDELNNAYNAELQLLEALPGMVRASKGDKLKQALDSHLKETQGHVTALVEVFEILEESPFQKKSRGMAALLMEAEKNFRLDDGDAELIAAIQKAERYEIAAYSTLCAWAKLLEETKVVQLLERILDEENSTEKKLAEIADDGATLESQNGPPEDFGRG